ncbi:MAG: peptide ABC transporter substrate-binding protein [Gammaproteobacteria bacterium]|nr:MAG: peptide ABC transporter substrate-binding protein [Gammaproteobacteria bacterium]
MKPVYLGIAALLLALSGAPALAEVVLNRGTAAEPPSLDPALGAGTLASPIIADLFVSLLAKVPDSTPQPGSAERWEVSDDGLSYRFYLREGLRWSDGRPLTAEDFVYSYRRVVDPRSGSRLAGVFFPVRHARAIVMGREPPESLGVSAPDERTVVFELERPTPYFLELIGNLQVAPVPRHLIEAKGQAWTRPGTMVSNGPYRLVERVPQSYIKLAKNPYFYDADKVRIDTVYWHPTQNLATSLKRFRAGELDIVLNFPPDQIDWIRENMPEALHITPALGTYFLVVNMRRPPFSDRRVREALHLAIDREAIANRLLRTGVRPAYSFVTPEFRGYPGLHLPEQDWPFAERQQRARELLAAAGFGPDEPLQVELLYDTQEENRKIMVAIAAMWRAIGVRTTLTDVEFRMLFRQVRTKSFGIARWFYMGSYNDAHAFLQLFLSNNPNNWPGFRSAAYDALLDHSNLVRDPEQRQAVLLQAERVLMHEYPVLPISYYVGRRLVSPRVKGWVDSPGGPTQSRYLWIE